MEYNMNKIKTSTENRYSRWAVALIALLVVATGCSISGIDKQEEEITEEDLQAASQILGESLSDETSGVMGSLNDAVTTISSEGFVRTSSPKAADEDDNSGRGREYNFSYTYDPATGMHTLAFKRAVSESNFSKSVTDTLKYIFTDNSGNFIAFPRQNKDRIESIDFKGFREGTVNSPERNSFFVRKDTFLIDGVSEASNTLFIDGVHNGEGNFDGTNDEGVQLQRDYELEINFLNIEIDKPTVQENQSLVQGVNGTLTYELVVTKTRNGSSSTKTIRGTIEMNGDGTALLRFERFQKLFQINLRDGDVRDQEDEFEGKVTRVNLDRSTFNLANGRTVRITDNTVIDEEGDLFNLEQVGRALEEGARVRAEGEGFVDGDVFVADEVEFEIAEEGNEGDGEKDRIRFEAFVHEVGLDNGIVVLRDERVLLINDQTQFDENGDFQSLAAVREALELDNLVVADGVGVETDEEDITFIVKEIRFDAVEREEFGFEGGVLEVNLEDSILALQDERIVWVNEETDIDESGDYQSLGAVKEALEQEISVFAFGEAVETNKEGIDLNARVIKFVINNENEGN